MRKQATLGDQAYRRANDALKQSSINNRARYAAAKLYRDIVTFYRRYGWDGSVVVTGETRNAINLRFKKGKTFNNGRQNKKFADLRAVGLIDFDPNGNVIAVVDSLDKWLGKPHLKPPKVARRVGTPVGTPVGASVGTHKTVHGTEETTLLLVSQVGD